MLGLSKKTEAKTEVEVAVKETRALVSTPGLILTTEAPVSEENEGRTKRKEDALDKALSFRGLAAAEAIPARQKFFKDEIEKLDKLIQRESTEHKGYDRISLDICYEDDGDSASGKFRYRVGRLIRDYFFPPSTVQDMEARSKAAELINTSLPQLFVGGLYGEVRMRRGSQSFKSLYCGPLPSEVREKAETAKQHFDELTVVSGVEEYFSMSPVPEPIRAADPMLIGWKDSISYFICAWDWEAEFKALQD